MKISPCFKGIATGCPCLRHRFSALKISPCCKGVSIKKPAFVGFLFCDVAVKRIIRPIRYTDERQKDKIKKAGVLRRLFVVVPALHGRGAYFFVALWHKLTQPTDTVYIHPERSGVCKRVWMAVAVLSLRGLLAAPPPSLPTGEGAFDDLHTPERSWCM